MQKNPQGCTESWVVPLDTFLKFCESCYNIPFKLYAASKMDLFVTKNRQWLETVVDCCYIELCFKCDSTPEYNYETHRYISIKAKKYSLWHLDV